MYKSGLWTHYKLLINKIFEFCPKFKKQVRSFFLKKCEQLLYKVTGLDSQGSSIETRSRSTLDTSRAKTSRNRFSAHNSNYNNNFNRFSSIFSCVNFLFKTPLFGERGKAGGHKPQHFPLPCHLLAFLSSGMVISHNHTVFHATTFDPFGNYYVFK